MLVTCWASDLGGCSNGLSGEHVVTKALFDGKAATVKGFGWCKDEFKTVGLNSLVANILCKHHNEYLSPVDEEAQRFRDALLGASNGTLVTGPADGTQYIQLDGRLWRRWRAVRTERLVSSPVQPLQRGSIHPRRLGLPVLAMTIAVIVAVTWNRQIRRSLFHERQVSGI